MKTAFEILLEELMRNPTRRLLRGHLTSGTAEFVGELVRRSRKEKLRLMLAVVEIVVEEEKAVVGMIRKQMGPH